MQQLLSRLAAVSVLFMSSVSWAGDIATAGSLTYGRVAMASPVPTLNGVMLVAMALLLSAIAFRVIKQKGNSAGRMMVLSLVGVGVLASGISGVKLISDANAIPGITHNLDTAGTVDINQYYNLYHNVGASDIEIKHITINPEFFCYGLGGNLCEEGQILQTGQECNITCEYDM